MPPPPPPPFKIYAMNPSFDTSDHLHLAHDEISTLYVLALQWRYNEYESVSNHQPYDCLLDRLLRRRSKKTSKLRVTGLCAGNSPVTGEFPHKGPVPRKMFPFDEVIMKNVDIYLHFISFRITKMARIDETFSMEDNHRSILFWQYPSIHLYMYLWLYRNRPTNYSCNRMIIRGAV